LSKNIRKISSFIHDLESLKAGCGSNMNNLLELVASYSPKNFIDLRLHDYSCGSEEFEIFFEGWASRMSKKSLSLTITNFFLSEDMKILIDIYTELGIIECISNYNRAKDEEEGCGLITLIMKVSGKNLL